MYKDSSSRREGSALPLVIVLLLVFACVAIVYVVTSDDDPATDDGGETYRATALLRCIPPTISFREGEGQASSLAVHEKLIRSHFVLQAALENPEIQQVSWVTEQVEAGRDPAQWLGQRIEVHGVSEEEPGLFQVDMVGDDPEQLRKIVDAVKDAYLDRVVDEDRKRLLKRRDLLAQLYTRKSEEIRKRREDLTEILRDMAKDTEDASPVHAEDYSMFLREEMVDLRKKIYQQECALRRIPKREKGTEPNQKQRSITAELEALQEDLAAVAAKYHRVSHRERKDVANNAELERRRERIDLLVNATRKIGTQLEQLQVELAINDKKVVALGPATVAPVGAKPISQADKE